MIINTSLLTLCLFLSKENLLQKEPVQINDGDNNRQTDRHKQKHKKENCSVMKIYSGVSVFPS